MQHLLAHWIVHPEQTVAIASEKTLFRSPDHGVGVPNLGQRVGEAGRTGDGGHPGLTVEDRRQHSAGHGAVGVKICAVLHAVYQAVFRAPSHRFGVVHIVGYIGKDRCDGVGGAGRDLEQHDERQQTTQNSFHFDFLLSINTMFHIAYCLPARTTRWSSLHRELQRQCG